MTKTTETVIYREIELKVTGTVTITKPDRSSWDSPDDYYGVSEVEDIEAKDESGAVVELTEEEESQASEAMLLAAMEDCDG